MHCYIVSTGFGVVPGTMILQSALTGKDGELSFIGSQKLMDIFLIPELQQKAQHHFHLQSLQALKVLL